VFFHGILLKEKIPVNKLKILLDIGFTLDNAGVTIRMTAKKVFNIELFQFSQAFLECTAASTWKIDSPGTAVEDDISSNKDFPVRPVECYVSGSMARGVEDLQL
jgi:hypothetical protein